MSQELKIVVLMIGILAPGPLTAATIVVPTIQPTIQAGIDAASPGDTVLVLDGTYTGVGNRDISFNGKAITVRSANGPDVTIIDCEDLGQGFVFTNNESSSSILDGFTIKDGRVTGQGGGIWCGTGVDAVFRNLIFFSCFSETSGGGMAVSSGGNPQIQNCVFDHNWAKAHGAGLFVGGGPVDVRNCTFSVNTASNEVATASHGGGIYLSGAPSTIVDTEIVGNVAWQGGGIFINSGDHDLKNVLVDGNTAYKNGGSGLEGGGIFVNGGQTQGTNLTFEGNVAPDGGAAIFGAGGSLSLFSSIVWDDTEEGPSGSISIDYSDVTQYSGTYPGINNINANPQFVSAGHGERFLSQVAAGQATNSPCINAGGWLAKDDCEHGVDGTTCMTSFRTRTDGNGDGSLIDMGFHYPVEVLFADDFENGDTWAWSKNLPGYLYLFDGGGTGDALGGRTGADLMCGNAVWGYPGLPRENVRAFISVSNTDEIRDMPNTYTVPVSREVVGPTGTKVGDDWYDLLDGDIDQSLQGAGVLTDAQYWYSGSNTDGSLNSSNCTVWTDNGTGHYGRYGDRGLTDYRWISRSDATCGLDFYHVLCVTWAW